MRALRKINNNVVVCTDSSGRELIAMGKGLGFGTLPREIRLSEVERTFYDIDANGQNVMSSLPSDVVLFSASLIDIAKNELSYELSPNAVLLMADHINFALERTRKQIHVRMPLAYDVKENYPVEYRLGRYAVERARKVFKVGLPGDEAVGIAMNLLNARAAAVPEKQPASDSDMVEEITEIAENYFHILIDRDSFNFSRYATHLQYLFQRIHQQKAIDSENLKLYKDLKTEFPDVADCVDQIAIHIEQKWNCTLSEEERLYLMLHVNRIRIKEGG